MIRIALPPGKAKMKMSFCNYIYPKIPNFSLKGFFFGVLSLEGLILGGAYIGKKVCVSKSARLIS